MGCSPEKVENPVASRSPDRHRWQAPPDPRLKPRKNTHFHLLKDACYTLRMEQPRPLDGSKVQTLAFQAYHDRRLLSGVGAAWPDLFLDGRRVALVTGDDIDFVGLDLAFQCRLG